MGHRAVITTEDERIGVYVHWNGGRDSIEGFLKYCDLQNFRPPEHDCYGWARLVQVIANFMGGDGLGVGIDTVDHLDCDNWDNGTYIIRNWEIVGRKYMRGKEQQVYDLKEFLHAINEKQPLKMQLAREVIESI